MTFLPLAWQDLNKSCSIASYSSIWSLKNDSHKYFPSSNDDDEIHLGFDWVPQRLILCHPTKKLFVSHESMSAGKSMLILAMFGDQFLNGHQRLISTDEMNLNLQRLFDRKMSSIEKAQ